MIGNKLDKVIQTWQGRKWKDPDLIADLKSVSISLERTVEELSTFEMYKAEVEAGALAWGPVHTELFWRENSTKFENNDFQLIRRLADLVFGGAEAIQEVACYDLGEFARCHPEGKRVIESMNACKVKIISLMSSPSAGLRKQSLLCIQKLMVQNWEFLNRKTALQQAEGK